MRKRLAGVLPFLALALVGVAWAAGSTSHPVLRPFVAGGAFESGMSGVGDGPSTPTGDHLRCWNDRHYAQNLTLRNLSRVPVTLIGAALDPPSAQIVRRVAVQFRLAPPPPNGDGLVIGLRDWNPSAVTPVTIPPGRSAWVQSNFLIHNCNYLSPHHALITNRAITVVFRANGHSGSQRIAVKAARMILTR